MGSRGLHLSSFITLLDKGVDFTYFFYIPSIILSSFLFQIPSLSLPYPVVTTTIFSQKISYKNKLFDTILGFFLYLFHLICISFIASILF